MQRERFQAISPVFAFIALASGLLIGCGKTSEVPPQRYADTDALFQLLLANVADTNTLHKVAEIDHSRLAHGVGSPLAPERVLIVSDPQLESALIKLNPLVAVDLPLRVLAFEPEPGAPGRIIYNSFDYLVSRYQLDDGQTVGLRQSYDQNIATLTRGAGQDRVASFPRDDMQPDGIITIESPYSFDETVTRVMAAIDSQDDTLQFGVVDFRANAEQIGIDIPPSYMILFGAPGPGAKAMADAPTLGLDGFCQKLLVWSDSQGQVYLSFNDLLSLAERQGVPRSIALRVINFRLGKVFSDALSAG